MSRVVVLGDSHSVLLGPAIVNAVRIELGWTLVGKISNVGWSTAQYVGSDTWAPALRTARPDVVIVILGTNDAAQSQQAYAAQLKKMIDSVRAAGVSSIIWVGPPSVRKADIDARIERIAPWQASFLPQMGVQWVDSRQLTLGGQAADGVHFTRAGYGAWAVSVADKLLSGGMVGERSAGSFIVPVTLALLAAGLLWATLRRP